MCGGGLVAKSCPTLWDPIAPLSMRLSRQEYSLGLPFPSPGDLPDLGTEPGSPALQEDSLLIEPAGKPCLCNRSPIKTLRRGSEELPSWWTHCCAGRMICCDSTGGRHGSSAPRPFQTLSYFTLCTETSLTSIMLPKNPVNLSRMSILMGL